MDKRAKLVVESLWFVLSTYATERRVPEAG